MGIARVCAFVKSSYKMAPCLRIAIAVAAVCGLTLAQLSTPSAQFGTVYGDTGSDAPYVQSISPQEGPKQGGTEITVQGAGFMDDGRAQCRFSRLNPNTEMTLTKTTSARYISSTEVRCEAPEWEEDACPNCVGSASLSGTFIGHTGSPYLRGTDTKLLTEIGVGDLIVLDGAQVGQISKQALTQYYEVKAIEGCTASAGCVCSTDIGWDPVANAGEGWQEGMYSVTQAYNATIEGQITTQADYAGGFEVITANTANCALYRYDKFTGCASGTWAAGVKITLSEPVYKIPGKPNVRFNSVT